MSTPPSPTPTPEPAPGSEFPKTQNSTGPIDCGCLERIRHQLEAHHGQPVDFELVPLVDFKTGYLRGAMPPLMYRFGSGRKRNRGHVGFNFCPFCGKPVR